MSIARGEPILLLDQDRARWDHLLIRRDLAALERAESQPGPLGPYTLQAATLPPATRARPRPTPPTGRASLHSTTRLPRSPSPVVTLNRAVAMAMAFGPAAGLEIVDALLSEPSLENYHLLPSVRGDLLARLDRVAEARAEFERAATHTRNARERALLLARAAACTGNRPGTGAS